MPKKLGKDEEILLFAVKIVAPVFAVFVVAIGIDLFSLFDWAGRFVEDVFWEWVA